MKRSIFRLSLVILTLCSFTWAPQAIAQIAPGVTQSAAHTANITGTVTQSDGMPIANADVKLSGTAVLSTKSDVHGTFNFTSVPWGTYAIVVTSAQGTVSRTNMAVNGDISVAIQYQAQNGPKVIANVSTSGAGAHINITSSSITSITPSEYAFQGNGTWKDLFAQIPGVAVSGYTGGGDAFVGSLVGSPQAPVVLSLNGALPYETSTTLDGMPLQGASGGEYIYNTGGGADLSTLPLNAFDTADVVRGPGANAPSIVDSVGGSFVLHGPGQVDANHFEFSASNDPYGGIVSNAKIALHLGRLSATFIYGVNDSPGPLGTNARVIPAISDTPATINGQTVWASTGGENANSPGVPNCYCSSTDTLLYCCVPQSTSWTEQSGAAALAYKVTPSITAEVFYAGSTSRQNTIGFYYPTEFTPSAAVPAYSGSLAPSPAGQANYTFLYASPEGPTTQANSLVEEKLTAFIGHGVLRLAALQYNSFNFLEYPANTAGFANGEYTLWGTANVGATSPGTPTAYNGTLANLTFSNYSFTQNISSHNRDLLGSYAVQVGSASSVGLSYVTSYYNSPYALDYFYGTAPPFYSVDQSSAASETTNETRLHFDTEIGDKLSLGLSWYFAEGTYHVPVPSNPNYWTNSVFPYSAPRFGAVWRASSNIAVRASAGGGYALPAIFDLTGYGLSCDPSVKCIETIGNLNLKPEETFGFDVGTDVRFHRNTVLSFDLYRTNLYGQFFTSTTESTLNGLPLFNTELGNLGTSLLEGINLDAHHDVPSGYYWRGTLAFTRGYVVSVPPGFYNNPGVPCTNCTNQNIIPGANFTSLSYSATVPYTSASAELGYRWNPGKYVDLLATYYGNNNIYLTPTAFVELDAHAGYALTRNVSLLATFRNITGVYDQSIETYSPSILTPVISGATGYYPGMSPIVPFGPRTVIVTVDWH